MQSDEMSSERASIVAFSVKDALPWATIWVALLPLLFQQLGNKQSSRVR
jgi:hypothetical protein